MIDGNLYLSLSFAPACVNETLFHVTVKELTSTGRRLIPCNIIKLMLHRKNAGKAGNRNGFQVFPPKENVRNE